MHIDASNAYLKLLPFVLNFIFFTFYVSTSLEIDFIKGIPTLSPQFVG